MSASNISVKLNMWFLLLRLLLMTLNGLLFAMQIHLNFQMQHNYTSGSINYFFHASLLLQETEELQKQCLFSNGLQLHCGRLQLGFFFVFLSLKNRIILVKKSSGVTHPKVSAIIQNKALLQSKGDNFSLQNYTLIIQS